MCVLWFNLFSCWWDWLRNWCQDCFQIQAKISISDKISHLFKCCLVIFDLSTRLDPKAKWNLHISISCISIFTKYLVNRNNRDTIKLTLTSVTCSLLQDYNMAMHSYRLLTFYDISLILFKHSLIFYSYMCHLLKSGEYLWIFDKPPLPATRTGAIRWLMALAPWRKFTYISLKCPQANTAAAAAYVARNKFRCKCQPNRSHSLGLRSWPDFCVMT